MGVDCIGWFRPSLCAYPHCPHEVRSISFRGDDGCLNPTVRLHRFGPTIRAKSRYSQKKPGPQFVTEKQKGLNV